MSTIDPISKKAFITVDSTSVLLAFQRKKYHFSMESIEKMYITKKRPGAWASLFGKLLAVRDTNYYLCVTHNNQETKIPINRLQRYYCVKLIALLRQSKNGAANLV